MKKRKFVTIYIAILCISLPPCFSESASKQLLNPPEVVMTEGMTITVTNKTGVLSISAGKGFKRSYTWDGATRTLILAPRKSRWVGRFGLLSPNGSFENNNSITRANIEESQWNFQSLEGAMSVLNHHGRMVGNTVYNEKGVMGTSAKARQPNPERKSGNVLLVTVYQIYINGKVPTKLPNSQNEKIIIQYQ